MGPDSSAPANDESSSVRGMVDKLTDAQQADKLRDHLRVIRAQQFEGNLSAMAREMGVTPAYLSDVLAGKRGVGMKLMRALASYTGESIDALVSGKPSTSVRAEVYPARGEAVRCVLEAVRRVSEAEYPNAEGRSVEWWLLEIHEVEQQLRRGADDADSHTRVKAFRPAG